MSHLEQEIRYEYRKYAFVNIHLQQRLYKHPGSSTQFSVISQSYLYSFLHFRLQIPCECDVNWFNTGSHMPNKLFLHFSESMLYPGLRFLAQFLYMSWQIVSGIDIQYGPPKTDTFLYPPLQRSWKGGILVSPCLSVRLSVRLSVCGQNRVRSVSSTILNGSISYLHILSSNFRRCVACKARFKIRKFEFFYYALLYPKPDWTRLWL